MAETTSAALPDVTSQPGDTITVSFDDTSTIVTKLNVYALNIETGQVEQVPNVQPLLAYVPIPEGA